MLRLFLFAVALAVATPAVFHGEAHAQAAADDDWGVKRNPFDKRIVDRWKAVLERDPSDSAALKTLVDLYTRYSKVDKLVAEYEARPDSYAKAMILAQLYRNGPDVDKALEWFDKAAALEPKNPTAQLARAEILLQRQKKDEARAAYEQSLPLARNPKEKKQILRALADLALDAGDIDKARATYDQIIALDPADVTARLDLADALAKHGRHDQSLAEYQEVVSRLATDPAKRLEIMARVGAEYEALGQPDKAIAVYHEAIDKMPRGHFLRKDMTERIIDIFRKKQDLHGLLTEFEKEWPAGSRGHFEWDVLARLYEETGEQDKALDAYRRAVAASPGELDTQKRLLALLERSGRDDELVKQYEALIRVAPGEPRFQLELAERIWKKGDKKRALAMAQAIASHFPDDAGVHSALAELYSRWGEDPLAVKEYEALVRIEPTDDTHLVNLGEQYFQRGDKARALDIWKRIGAAKTPEAYARLAEVFAEHDLGADAIEMYQRALALKPRDPSLWKGLAGVHERQRQDDRALDAWEHVMDVANGDATQKLARREARTRIIAILFRKSGQPLLAKSHEWARRFEATPPDMEAGYRLVEAYLKLSRLEDAQRVLARILEVDPKDLDAKHQLVAVYKSERKYPEAIELLKQLAADQPGLERQYYAEIAELELALYHDEEAISYAQKALEKSPNDPQAQERLAEIYSKKEDFVKATEAYKRAIALAPRNYKVYFSLAKLYLRDGKYEPAAALYRDIVKHASDEETVRSAARKAIDLQEYLGTLGDLEQEIAPLAFVPTNRSTYRRIIVEVYDRYVPPLVTRARSGNPADAAAAQKELARLGEHGLKPLLEALEDGTDPAQQRVAVRVLGYLGNKNAAAPLARLALEAAPGGPSNPNAIALPGGANAVEPSTDMDVRVEALVAAGRLADPRVIPQLVQILGNREVALREAAAWALGQTRNPHATDALTGALKDSRSSVHVLACLGLGRIGDRRSLDRAAEVMKDPAAGAEARAACAYALGEARSAASVPALIEVVTTAADDVQVKAAWALGRIGDARAVPALLRAYWPHKQLTRDAIAWALTRIAAGGDSSPLAFDDVGLDSGKIDYRALVRGLAETPPTALDPMVLRGHGGDVAAGIVEVLNGGRRDLIVHVLRDLDAVPGGLALGPFTAALAAQKPADRATLDQIIDQVGTQIAGPVSDLCDSPDAEIKGLALDVAAKLHGEASVARIDKALDDESLPVRLAALGALRAYVLAHGTSTPGTATLVAKAASRLTSPAWRERTAAVDALAGAGADPAQLVNALADPSGFVRESAARGLGDMKRVDSVPALVTASHDEVAEVRLESARALLAIGGPAAHARLTELAGSDPDARVRAASAGGAKIPAPPDQPDGH